MTEMDCLHLAVHMNEETALQIFMSPIHELKHSISIVKSVQKNYFLQQGMAAELEALNSESSAVRRRGIAKILRDSKAAGSSRYKLLKASKLVEFCFRHENLYEYLFEVMTKDVNPENKKKADGVPGKDAGMTLNYVVECEALMNVEEWLELKFFIHCV